MIYAEDLLKSGRRGARRTAPLFGRLGGLARELSMAIGITFLEKCGEGCRNTLVLCDWKGKRVLTYAKVHTCEFGEEADLMLKGGGAHSRAQCLSHGDQQALPAPGQGL